MSTPKKSWSQAFKAYLDKRALIMLFLGFSAGIPILLIFSSLSLWLREAGVDRSTVTMFSWAALGYSFKFIWAPLIDAVPVPILSGLFGRRRAWLLVAQGLIITAILIMASINPAEPQVLTMMAFGAVLLGFSSATQDIVIDAYRIELANSQMQSVLSATYNAGYRIGMIVAGAGALFLAEGFGSVKGAYLYEAWRNTYWIMAGVMGVGVATTLFIHEPTTQVSQARKTSDYVRLVVVFLLSVVAFVMAFIGVGQLLPESKSVLASFLIEAVNLLVAIAVAVGVGTALVKIGVVQKQVAVTTWVEPILDFFRRYGKKAVLLLLLIGLYRISDIVAGVISNVFYEDMGFSKTEIATAVKTFGVLMVIVGGFVGGIVSQRFRIMQAMMIGGVLACLTNLMFVMLAMRGHDIVFMYLAVAFDNLASGLAGAVFIAFLSALTNIRFTAVQYAIFSSLMTLIPKVLGGYSGTIVDNMGYAWFFTFTTLIGLPILWLIYLVDKQVMISNTSEQDANSNGSTTE
ncbi:MULTISPECIES: AmpG family muropeptide MFS transporter [unclassified Moraxella]|uniref:AmpG family muropeptide MFS transporter n=1 Tax=unclassified Moraxella TaxID=2685852 RepID=UPI003AF9680B